MSIDRFTPQEGQVVTAQGHTGTFKVLDVSADGQTADIQAVVTPGFVTVPQVRLTPSFISQSD